MTREDVIRQIVERERQGRGLSAEVVRREATPLHAAACEHFGTWDTALRYAGISRRRLRAEAGYSPDRVLREVRRLCKNGYSLRAGHNQRRDPELYDAARRHFAGWKRALRAAGIDLKHAGLRTQPRRLDKQAIIAALQQRHREGRPPLLRCMARRSRLGGRGETCIFQLVACAAGGRAGTGRWLGLHPASPGADSRELDFLLDGDQVVSP